MKWVKVAIGAVITIAIVPMIVVTTNSMINLQSEIPVTFEILNDNNNFSDITLGTYESLIENKKITNYRISSEYPLIKNSEIEISKYFINEELKNEMYTDVDGYMRIIENVGKDENGNFYELTIKNPKSEVIVYHSTDTSIPDKDVLRFNLDFENTLMADNNIIVNGQIYNYFLGDAASPVNTWRPLGSNSIYLRVEKGITLPQNSDLTYELAQPRLAETYDLTSFQLDFHDHSLSILFNLNDEYQRWRIYEGDVLQMLDGEQIVGNKWTVTFEVYEVQSPILRSLIALVPIIFIAGVLSYLLVTFKETE